MQISQKLTSLVVWHLPVEVEQFMLQVENLQADDAEFTAPADAVTPLYSVV